jgi:hypothetical protein
MAELRNRAASTATSGKVDPSVGYFVCLSSTSLNIPFRKSVLSYDLIILPELVFRHHNHVRPVAVAAIVFALAAVSISSPLITASEVEETTPLPPRGPALASLAAGGSVRATTEIIAAIGRVFSAWLAARFCFPAIP